MSIENPNSLMYTEDGHPIGQVVVLNNSYPRSPSQEEREEALRQEVELQAAQDLTGEVDPDLAIMQRFPEYTNLEKREQAMKLFIEDHYTVEEISDKLSVPGRTISMWAFKYRWNDLLKREVLVQHTQSVLGLARLRNSRRLEVAKEQLEQAKKIRDKAMKAIETGDTSIKSGAEAWAAAAKIEHTLTGVSEAGSVTNVDGEQAADKKDGNGKVPLVMVFNNAGGLPPIRKSENNNPTVINV